MSWSFKLASKDKEKMREAAHEALNGQVGGPGETGRDKVAGVHKTIDAAMDAVKLPAAADYLSMECTGHADSTQCFFSIAVIPVYRQQLVEDRPKTG